MFRPLTISWLFACAGCQYPPLPPVFETEACNLSSVCRSQNASLPVCDLSLNGGTCVACTSTEHDFCTNNTPRCDNNTCVACAEDVRDCGAGGLCLPSGACVAAANLLHANSNGSSDSDCGTVAKPCTLDRALAIAMTEASKTSIKLDNAGPYRAFVNDNYIVDANVTLDMRGATLDRNFDGPILEIRPGRTVTLLGGTIQNATGSNGDGILCGGNLTVIGTTIKMTEKSAINMTGGNLIATQVNVSSTSLRSNTFVPGILGNGDSITLSRSTIVANRGGGVRVGSGTFKLVGNALLNNGDGMSTVGGLSINTSQNAVNRLDFNTISKSNIQDGTTTSGGIDCNAGTTFVARYNIFWNNKQNTVGTTSAQISGGCKFTYSDAAPSAIPAINSVGSNLNMDPMLVNENNDARLKMNSPAIGYADPAADLTGLAAIDIDGDMRAKRTDKGADIGADQYKP